MYCVFTQFLVSLPVRTQTYVPLDFCRPSVSSGINLFIFSSFFFHHTLVKNHDHSRFLFAMPSVYNAIISTSLLLSMLVGSYSFMRNSIHTSLTD